MLRVGVGNHWTCLVIVGYRLCSSSLSLRAALGGLPGKTTLRFGLHFGSRTHVVRTPRVSTLLHKTLSYRLTAITLRWFTMLVCKRAKRLKRKTLSRRKRTRSLAILKQQRKAQRPGHRKYKQRTLWKVGVRNVRRWVHPMPYDPWTKTCSIFKLARQRQWNVVLLTDVAFPESTPKQIKVDGITWSIVLHVCQLNL